MQKKIGSIVVCMLLATTVLSALSLSENTIDAAAPVVGPTLNPRTIPKFVDQLIIPPIYEPTIWIDANGDPQHNYTIDVTEFYEQILPAGFPQTKVWGYGGNVYINPITGQPGYFRYTPGATFEAVRGIPIQVKWINSLTNPHMFPVDPTLHWANPNNMMMPTAPFTLYPPGYTEAQSPVPIVTHLHGGEVQSTSDGHPEAWWTQNGLQGVEYNTQQATDPNAAIYYYPNTQLPTTLWYHDHALGITRINVMSGLAGFYLLRDPADIVAPQLPQGQYEVPIVIQDRSFNVDGSFWFPTVGIDPTISPYWQPEFFGDSIMVNGKMWPNFNVEPRQYRFRLLDGSNARFYTLSFWDKVTGISLPFNQIGGDGGYLPTPAPMTSLTIAPGERADIVIDFSAVAPGTKIILKNTAKAPFPSGATANPQTVGQIMQFTVGGTPITPTPLPTNLITMPVLTPDAPSKTLTLFEVMGPLGPKEILLDGQKWHMPVSELPQVGSTVDWIIVNPTADAHPIHLHLVQFQVVSRQKYQVNKYVKDWITANGGMMPPFMNPTVSISLAPYLVGNPTLPPANELGWKDTVEVFPGEITILRIRFSPQDVVSSTPGVNQFAFDPTVGPGYVWHCHILDHEDNEMMRPYSVTN